MSSNDALRAVNDTFHRRGPPALLAGYEAAQLSTIQAALEAVIRAQIVSPATRSSLDRALEKVTNPPLNASDAVQVQAMAAVVLYTDAGEFYSSLNELLRNEDRDRLRPCFGMIKWLMIGLCKYCELHRGPACWRGVAKDLRQEYKRDQELTWWSFSSLSTDISSSKSFLGPAGTLFMVECVSGRSISALSHFEEAEVLLPPATRFRVIDVTDLSGYIIIHLLEISCPWPAIEPPLPDLVVHCPTQIEPPPAPSLASPTAAPAVDFKPGDFVRVSDGAVPIHGWQSMAPGDVVSVLGVLRDQTVLVDVAGFERQSVQPEILRPCAAPTLPSELRSGAWVRLSDATMTSQPSCGWQGLNGSFEGTLVSVNQLGGCIVEFPSVARWRCKAWELDIVSSAASNRQQAVASASHPASGAVSAEGYCATLPSPPPAMGSTIGTSITECKQPPEYDPAAALESLQLVGGNRSHDQLYWCPLFICHSCFYMDIPGCDVHDRLLYEAAPRPPEAAEKCFKLICPCTDCEVS